MKPLNLLYDGLVFAVQRYGGVSRLFYELISRVSQINNTRVHLYHGLHINGYPLEDFRNQMAFYWGKPFPRFPRAPIILKYLNNPLFNLAVYNKPIDIYHPTGYRAGISGWKKSPVVVTVNDMIPERFPDQFRDICSRLKAKKKTILRADHIISISRFTRQDLIDIYNIPGSRITVIYPGGPSSDFSPAPPVLESTDPVTESGSRGLKNSHISDPYILYVGTRKQKYKNFPALLTAYTSSRVIHKQFHLVCFGGPPFTRDENKQIHASGCTGRVFHRSGPDPVLADLYRGAALFIYPSLIEGFGIPPLEAMACGCPVISSNAPPMPEILGDAAVYFDPRDPGNLASVMESVLSDPAALKTLSAEKTRQALTYRWARMADQTLALYREISGQN